VTATYDQNDTIYEISASDSITVNIGLPPEINADATPKNVGYGLDVTIDANATDDQGIKSVWAKVQKPDGNEFNVNMSNVGGNEYQGIFQPWEEGNYTIYVYAEDLYDSVSQAGPITVTAEANAEMGVETDKNFYLQGELVKLKSPAWWNINWKYRMPVVVKNPSTSSDMNNYPVRIELNTEKLIDEGHLRWDAGDLRFVTEDGNNARFRLYTQPHVQVFRLLRSVQPNGLVCNRLRRLFLAGGLCTLWRQRWAVYRRANVCAR